MEKKNQKPVDSILLKGCRWWPVIKCLSKTRTPTTEGTNTSSTTSSTMIHFPTHNPSNPNNSSNMTSQKTTTNYCRSPWWAASCATRWHPAHRLWRTGRAAGPSTSRCTVRGLKIIKWRLRFRRKRRKRYKNVWLNSFCSWRVRRGNFANKTKERLC